MYFISFFLTLCPLFIYLFTYLIYFLSLDSCNRLFKVSLNIRLFFIPETSANLNFEAICLALANFSRLKAMNLLIPNWRLSVFIFKTNLELFKLPVGGQVSPSTTIISWTSSLNIGQDTQSPRSAPHLDDSTAKRGCSKTRGHALICPSCPEYSSLWSLPTPAVKVLFEGIWIPVLKYTPSWMSLPS